MSFVRSETGSESGEEKHYIRFPYLRFNSVDFCNFSSLMEDYAHDPQHAVQRSQPTLLGLNWEAKGTPHGQP